MDDLQSIVKSLSKSPGIYQFFNQKNEIIYIGKAKNLKNRVSSYFNKVQFENRKTKLLVSQIKNVKTIKVETEMDALLLENVLVKKHQPKYNVQLKDDKTYPWICIKNEPFSRITTTRRVLKDGAKYYGPYPSVKIVKQIIAFLIENFNIRNCSHDLKKNHFEKGQLNTALEFYIGNCKGCCQGDVSEQEYGDRIKAVSNVLNGNVKGVLKELKLKMKQASDLFLYEQAQDYKTRIIALENYQSKSTIVSNSIDNVDVFSIEEDQHFAYINYLKVIDGTVNQSRMIEVKKKLDETSVALIEKVIADVFQHSSGSINELIIPFEISLELSQKITVPERGDKKKLIDISKKNAFYYMKEKHRKEAIKNPESSVQRVLETIKKDLRLPVLPKHMECFDNSNFQGVEPVAACVVFKDGKPAKREYRHFNIKTVVGPDDFSSMEEVVFRRYKRILEEKKELPQLIILDGGKGQLSSAIKSLSKLNLMGKVAVVAIAKKLEEIYFPGDKLPLYIDKKSESLRIIQQMRNEAHRFGIEHHRKKRIKSTLQSEITNIKGIGAKTLALLMKEFKTVKKIKTLKVKELQKSIGLSKAKIVYNYFNNDQQ
jgi:excinuclease ABC subunit C